jgi:hypothetical protein
VLLYRLGSCTSAAQAPTASTVSGAPSLAWPFKTCSLTMRLFMDLSPRGEQGGGRPGALSVRKAEAYDEIEWVIAPELPSFVLYRLRVTSAISHIVACCGDALDAILNALRSDDLTLQALYRYRPVLAILIAHGQLSDFSSSGLFLRIDPDDGVKKSFIGATIRPEGLAEPVLPADLRAAIVRVLLEGVALVQQGTGVYPAPPNIVSLERAPRDGATLRQQVNKFPIGFPFLRLGELLDSACSTE